MGEIGELEKELQELTSAAKVDDAAVANVISKMSKAHEACRDHEAKAAQTAAAGKYDVEDHGKANELSKKNNWDKKSGQQDGKAAAKTEKAVDAHEKEMNKCGFGCD